MSELQLHDARSNLCRFHATSRGDTHEQAQQPMGPKASSSSKSNWKGQNKYSEGGRFQSLNKFNRASGGAFDSGGYGHGDSSLGQKSKLPPREQTK